MVTLAAAVGTTTKKWQLSAPLPSGTTFLLAGGELVSVISPTYRAWQWDDPDPLLCVVKRGVVGRRATHAQGVTLTPYFGQFGTAALDTGGGGGGVTGTDGTTTVDPLTSLEFPTGMLADAGGGAGSAMGGLGIGFRVVSTGADDADATTYATSVDGTAYGQNAGATGDGRADATSVANTAGDGTALARKQAVATGDGDANADSSAATSGFGGATSNTSATAHGNGNAATNTDAIAEGNGNARAVITAGVLGTGSATGGLIAIASGGQSGVDIVSDVTSARMGFNGSTPIAKPTVTGSRGGNAALASLLTQLAALGLITDSSS